MKVQVLPPRWWSTQVLVLSDLHPNELYSVLSDREYSELRALPSEKRRQEWATARVAVKMLAVERGLTSDPRLCEITRGEGKPQLLIRGEMVKEHISLSHSHLAAAAAIGDTSIGVDLQDVRDTEERAAKFFLSMEETEMLRSLVIENRIIHLWAAKEAAWKAWGRLDSVLRNIHLVLEEWTDRRLSLRWHADSSGGRVETVRLNPEFVLAVAEQCD